MTDTWQNTWDRTGQPRPWDSEIVWRRWEKATRERSVENHPGEIAMTDCANKDPSMAAAGQQPMAPAGQQRPGWGAAVEPVDAETLERLAATGDGAHVRSMARELLLHRKDAFERQVKAQSEQANERSATDRLEQIGAAPLVSGGDGLTQREGMSLVHLANMLDELARRRTGDKERAAMEEELKEWRDGRRVAAVQLGVRAMFEVLVNQGWTPPQS